MFNSAKRTIQYRPSHGDDESAKLQYCDACRTVTRAERECPGYKDSTLAKHMIKLRLTLVACAAAALSAGCGTPRIVIEAEDARTNTHVVLAFEETVLNRHRVREGFERYAAADYKLHTPAGVTDFDASIDKLTAEVTKSHPNSRVTVKRTVAQRDLVTVQAFWDQEPGQTPGVIRVDTYRLINSKIVEHWQVAQPLSGPDSAANQF
jgi:predicted SnoaL-like aldol condensation-catalyzing enzyme